MHVQLIDRVGEDEAEMYTLNISNVMLRHKLLLSSPLEGKTFTIANLGRAPGKNYYEYKVEQL